MDWGMMVLGIGMLVFGGALMWVGIKSLSEEKTKTILKLLSGSKEDK